MNLSNICEVPSFLRVMLILKYLFKIVCIVVPIIIIITTIISLFKSVTSGKDEDLKDTFKLGVRKIIAGLVIGFLPTIIPYIISQTGEDTLYEFKECTSRVTEEEIKYYEKIESVALVIEKMSNNPTTENIEEGKKAIEEAKSYLKEDQMIKYLTAVSDAEVEQNRVKKVAECQNKGGRYENGYCFERPKYVKPSESSSGGSSESSGSESGSGSESSGSGEQGTYEGGGSGNGTTTLNILGGQFTVVNTKTNVTSFASAMRKNGTYQGSNSDRYGGYCLGFSYTHAWGMYTGNTSYNGENGHSYTGAGNFTTYINDDLQQVLNVVYQEVTAGRPIILQVNGNTKGTSRHFVTVIGFKSNVKNAASLKATDLLILDSWDAKIERMDQSGSRFVTTGKACHKDYSGYRVQYLKK